jgi:RNA polymerase sigma-70 factor, ECF subfamily
MTPMTDLWQQHKVRVRGCIAWRVREDTAVNDILQDVFLKVHTGLPRVKSSGSLAAWLFRIAGNAMADHYRSKSLCLFARVSVYLGYDALGVAVPNDRRIS